MKKNLPLAFRMRPNNLDEFVGQEHLIGEGKPLRVAIDNNSLNSSIIFWGPPGCGKTTLAKLIAKKLGYEFVELSAVKSGKADIEKIVQRSRLFNSQIILFLDEIHRFNKAQQDFLLPFVESGTILLIGATTENHSFEINSALLSRSRVFVLNSLEEEHLLKIINRVIEIEKINLSEENKKLIAHLSNGDARNSLNILDIVKFSSKEITRENILNSVQKTLNYDKNGEEHYNIISALHKSMRDSDVDASIYLTMRMVEAGEDPKYIIRRMIRFASEDIGNADSQALVVETSAKQAIEFLGYPECNTALVQTAIYLAKAPKSNSTYEAVNLAKKDISETGNLPVPLHLRNAPTNLMKNLGYGKNYKYFHDDSTAKDQQHLPDKLIGKKYYKEK